MFTFQLNWVTLSDLLHNPWSQVSCLLPRVRAFILLRVGFSIPAFQLFCSSMCIELRQLATHLHYFSRRVQHFSVSAFYARRCALNFVNSLSRTFSMASKNKEILEGFKPMTSISTVKRFTVEPAGTPIIGNSLLSCLAIVISVAHLISQATASLLCNIYGMAPYDFCFVKVKRVNGKVQSVSIILALLLWQK